MAYSLYQLFAGEDGAAQPECGDYVACSTEIANLLNRIQTPAHHGTEHIKITGIELDYDWFVITDALNEKVLARGHVKRLEGAIEHIELPMGDVNQYFEK